MASATAGNGVSVTTGNTTIYDQSVGPGRGILISNRSASAGNVLVNALGVHAAGDFAGIAPGQSLPFIVPNNGALGNVTVKTDTSTATIDFTIVR